MPDADSWVLGGDGEALLQDVRQAAPEGEDSLGVLLVQLQVIHLLGHRLDAQDALGSVVDREPDVPEGKQPRQSEGGCQEQDQASTSSLGGQAEGGQDPVGWTWGAQSPATVEDAGLGKVASAAHF